MVPAARQSRLLGEVIDVGPGLVVPYMPPLLLPRLAKLADAEHAMAWFHTFSEAIVAGTLVWIVLNVVLLHRFGQTAGTRVVTAASSTHAKLERSRVRAKASRA